MNLSKTHREKAVMRKVSSAIARFLEYLPKANGSESNIIEAILKDPEGVAMASSHNLACEAHVAISSVTRFCKKLGFQDYREFQRTLNAELALRRATVTEKSGEFQIRPEDSLELLVNNSFERTISVLSETKNMVDVATLQTCAKQMKKASTIVFFGVGASHVVAEDAYLKFTRVGKRCQISGDQDVQQVLAKNMSEDDLAVIISYSGKTAAMVAVADTLQRKLVPSIAITASINSPIQKKCTYNLCVSAAEVDLDGGKMVSRIAQLAMIDALYTAYFQQTYQESADALRSTQIQKHEEDA